MFLYDIKIFENKVKSESSQNLLSPHFSLFMPQQNKLTLFCKIRTSRLLKIELC